MARWLRCVAQWSGVQIWSSPAVSTGTGGSKLSSQRAASRCPFCGTQQRRGLAQEPTRRSCEGGLAHLRGEVERLQPIVPRRRSRGGLRPRQRLQRVAHDLHAAIQRRAVHRRQRAAQPSQALAADPHHPLEVAGGVPPAGRQEEDVPALLHALLRAGRERRLVVGAWGFHGRVGLVRRQHEPARVAAGCSQGMGTGARAGGGERLGGHQRFLPKVAIQFSACRWNGTPVPSRPTPTMLS